MVSQKSYEANVKVSFDILVLSWYGFLDKREGESVTIEIFNAYCSAVLIMLICSSLVKIQNLNLKRQTFKLNIP